MIHPFRTLHYEVLLEPIVRVLRAPFVRGQKAPRADASMHTQAPPVALQDTPATRHQVED